MQIRLSYIQLRTLFLGFFFLLVPLRAKAQSVTFVTPVPGSDCDQAENFVAKFLKLDAEIGRTSKRDYDRYFDSMILYNVDGKIVHEEPAWDAAVIIRGYKLTGCAVQGDNYLVMVAYDNLGIESSNGECPSFTPTDQFTSEVYKVRKIGKDWKLIPPAPHISVKRAIALLDENEPPCMKEKKKLLHQIQEALKKKSG